MTKFNNISTDNLCNSINVYFRRTIRGYILVILIKMKKA
jgi:hypothetical protein